MEQPGVRRTRVNSRIEALLPLNYSDIAKAAYAMKAEDWSDTCPGEIDVYRTCGSFRPSFVLPFVSLASFIVVSWWLVVMSVRDVSINVPVDARAWRRHALKAIRKSDTSSERSEDFRKTRREEALVSQDDVFDVNMLEPSIRERREDLDLDTEEKYRL